MKSNSFIERTILGGLAFWQDAFFAEEYALKKGFLQSLDGRVKLATFLLLVLQALFAAKISTLAWLYSFCLLLVVLSKIRLGFFLKRTWVFIPLFSLFIVLPAVFSRGEPLLTLKLGWLNLAVSRQGAASAAVFLLRLVTCLSWVMLLNLTTRHFTLLKVLRVFKIPQVFVMILGMAYRYIYLFIEIIRNTYWAIKSRIGGKVEYRPGQEIVAWNIAALWERSSGLNEEVYKAMLSRGFGGQIFAWEEFKFGLRDLLWILAAGIWIWVI